MRQTPLKRGKRRRLTREQRAAAAEFRGSIEGKPCVVCGRDAEEAHHVISADYLRRNHPGRVYEADNALPLCRDCHGRHTNASRRIPIGHLLRVNREFADELGLGWYLDRYYEASA